jgi:hypothetical protein
MRYTIITDQSGNLVGSVKGDVLSEKQGDVEATLVAGPGQRLHHIDVEDEIAKVTDPDEMHKKLAPYLSKLPKK